MSIIDNAKEIADLVKKVGDIDLYRKIVDLQAEVVQLSTRNFELEKKVKDLEDDLHRKQSLKHVRLVYYADGDPIPFCPRCWEGNNKLIHLFGPLEMWGDQDAEGWQCRVCYYDYTAKEGENFHARKTRERP
jgi:hypothetical protein